MPTLANSKFPPPKDAGEFEDIVCDAANLSTEWGATDFKRYGRSGQKQDGLDVYSQTVQVGLQCKNVTKLTQKIITTEIGNAEKFTAKLTKLCVATTAPRDATIQGFVFNLSEQRVQRKEFAVSLWFWDDIIQNLAKDERQIKKHFPQPFGSQDQNADRYLKLLEAAQLREDDLLKKTRQLEAKNAQIEAEKSELAQRLARDTQQGANNPAADQAVAGLERGDLTPTADYLRQIEQAEFAQGAASFARAAAAARQRAAISPTAEAVQALQRATEYEPDNALNWQLLGDMQLQSGKLPQAESAYRTMQHLTATASKAQPSDYSLQRDLSVSHDRIGDIQQAQGDRAGALLSYRASLTIRERLTHHDTANTQWQRDLSVSHNKIGNIQQEQGDLAGALLSFRAGLTIREDLAQLDVVNTEWRRDLSVSHEKIGDIQTAQGDLAGALLSYRASHALAERLALHDAANTLWQRDLSVSHNKIGDIQQAQGDLAGALVSYRAGLTIAERLALHDAANTLWQRDLSVSHNKIGDIQQAQGDLAGALVSYRAGLTIAERLALHDAANVQWQTGVVVSCWKLAKVSQGEEAKGFLRRGLAILERLAKEDRLDADQKNRWLKLFRDALAK